jgi:hypothetical protein
MIRYKYFKCIFSTCHFMGMSHYILSALLESKITAVTIGYRFQWIIGRSFSNYYSDIYLKQLKWDWRTHGEWFFAFIIRIRNSETIIQENHTKSPNRKCNVFQRNHNALGMHTLNLFFWIYAIEILLGTNYQAFKIEIWNIYPLTYVHVNAYALLK